MSSTVLVIANPVSGGGRGVQLAQRLEAALRARGCNVSILRTTKERTGRHLVREALARLGETAIRAIVAVGGDGSVNDVLAGLDGRAVPVTVLRAGTANVWAREARLPAEPERLADVVLAGRTVDVALGRANREMFFLFVGVGLDARVVHDVEQRRRAAGGHGGMAQWVLPGLRAYLSRPEASLVVRVGERVFEDIGQVLITRIRAYAGFLSMPSGITITDDHLHVLAFPRAGKLAYLARGLRAALGRLRDGHDLVHVTTTEEVLVDSPNPEPWHRDGDDAGRTPVRVGLDPRRARLLVPPADDAEV